MGNSQTKLLAYRTRHDLKQETLADVMGVSQGTLSRWEAGTLQPSPHMKGRIKDLLRKDSRLDLRRMERRVIMSPRRALCVTDDLRLHAHGMFMYPQFPVGTSILPHVSDFARNTFLANRRAIMRGELLAAVSYRMEEAITQSSSWAYFSNTANYAVIDGRIVSDNTFHELNEQEWQAIGGTPRYELITLDDEAPGGGRMPIEGADLLGLTRTATA